MTRFGFALWGGLLLHVGLLVLIAAALVQKAFHDTAAFDLTLGEAVRLSEPGAVLARERGPLAAEAPPDLVVTLERFDPFLRQEGYAPDRLSRIAVIREGGPRQEATLDRASGARFGRTNIFQAIPMGLSVNLEIAGMGTRSIHLVRESERLASASVLDPSGGATRFVIATERPVDDPVGTGRLRVRLERGNGGLVLEPGAPFSFGGREARIVSIGRWGRFTYSRGPGMLGVFAGFSIVLLGCALLAFPAGVARIDPPGMDPVASVFLLRGREALIEEWQAHMS